MYEKFYGFKENPFTITPDPKFFFPSPKHTEVLDSLIYTVTERRGFAVITGEIGSGKTTICRTLVSRLNPGTKVAMITNTYLSPKELLSYTLEELGVTFNGGEKSNLLSCLKKFLVEQLYLDFNVVLIIDEAQNLSLKVLEELRMLSNLETEKKKMIQIILTGQPALKDKLASKELDQLRQRINVQYHIPPLNRINNERYINHRLEVASINGNRKVEFTPEAIDKIYAHSQGIPRVINMICNNALLIGYVTEAAQITPQIIKEAIEEFQNEIKVDKTIISLPKETESKLTQLNEELKKAQEENSQLKLKQETLSSQLKASLNLYESTIAGKQSELDRINKNLQSNQETLNTTQSSLSQREAELETKQSQLQATETQIKQLNEQLNSNQERLTTKQSQLQAVESRLKQINEQLNQLQKDKEGASRQLQATESKLSQLNEELKKAQEENSQLKLKQEAVSSQLKASLNLYESTIAGKQVELDRINKNLQSSQRALNDTESKCHQKYSELGQVKQDKQKLQAEEERLRQTHLERQKEWEQKQEEISSQMVAFRKQLKLYESAVAQKQSELAQLDRNITQLKEELKNLQEQKIRCQQEQEKLNQAWLNHQLAWQQKEKEILEESKFTPISKTAEGETFKNSIDKPIIKLKPKKPKTNAAILAASHLRGEIKIDPIGNDDFLSSVYSGIRIFHRNGDIGNYKNFIFSAKGDKKRDYSTVFRVELNNNGAMKVGKHHSVRVTDSWQKFNIPLEDFSRMINLNIITEIAIFLDAITEADDITYMRDIHFSNT